MEVEFEPTEDCCMLYEAAVEEIALEGLDGITFQGLCERLSVRVHNPLCKAEANQVLETLWSCLLSDVRLRFYLLAHRRPILQIWDRNQHLDPKGNVEEPADAPEEIYTYKCIEVKDSNARIAKRRAQQQSKIWRNQNLSKDEVDRISIGRQHNAEVKLEGIRFSNLSSPVCTSEKTKDEKLKIKSSRPNDTRGRGGCTGSVSTIATRGSCPEFDTRKDITDILRQKQVSYVNALNMMGNRLVIVASQFLRESLLFQTSNQIDINGLQYCVVERVGRARYFGEQARGKTSLTVLGVDAKTLFYMRTVLLADGIISKQPLIMRFGNSKTATLISVFHLPHFFCRQEHPEAVKIRKIFAYVCNAPNNYVDYFKLQGIFGKYLMRTLVDEYKDFIKVDEVLFSVLYPEDLENEKKLSKKDKLAKRKIRIITLRNPDFGLRDLIQKQLRKHEAQDEDGPDGIGSGEQQGVGESEDPTFDWSFCYAPEHDLAHESELLQIVRLLIQRGQLGIKQQELSEEMSMTSLDARSAFRYILRWKIANSHLEDIGKTKANCLTYFKCGVVKQEKKQVESSIDIEDDNMSDAVLGLKEELILPDVESTQMQTSSVQSVGHDVSADPAAINKNPFVWKSRKTLPQPMLSPKRNDQEGLSTIDPLGTSTKKDSKQRKNKRTAADIDLPPPIIRTKRVRDNCVDFVDVQASNYRDRLRADWSPEEDRALLFVFIASVLFIPRYNLEKVSVYNAIQIRDILHRRLPETKAKTSSIVRRRIHTMFKSVMLFSKYRTMLDKALRDEKLYATLIEPHLPPPSITIFHKVCNSALESVIDYITNMFDPKKSEEYESSKIPDVDIQTDLETLLDSRELRRMEMIWIDVWSNVFHLFYKSKKTLTPIVPMQPFEVMQLQTEGLVIEEQGPSWLLPYVPSSPTDSDEPDEPCTYTEDQLEFAFDVANTLVSTADKVINEEAPSSSSDDDEADDAAQSFPAKNNGVINLKKKGQGGYVSDLCSGDRNPSSSTEVFAWTCRTIFMSVLLGGGGSPESLRGFMSPISDTSLGRLANSLRARGVFTMVKRSRKLILTSSMKRKLTNYLHPNAFRTANLLMTSLHQNSHTSCSTAHVRNIGTAYLLAEIGPLVNINYIMPSSIITVREEWREDYESILSSQQVAAAEGSEEIALRLLRFRLNADTSKSRLVEKDFFDINLPHIEVNSKPQVSFDALVYGEGALGTEKLVLERILLHTIPYDAQRGVIGAQDPIVLGSYEGLYKLIDITEDVGISVVFLLVRLDT
ncbi:uncharacterized protein LOC110863338 isoform X2 [Folsomia candida]|uniref:uncharacterized protein LOC110863338 isoform X2 n=1 Tax=Folsomia candida TaxID=158441 RepID=UPI00160527E9|nr:uncharacterized protein LOC110863338 isoform X2 [Folsomia candida]